jgi:hypothetical protein
MSLYVVIRISFKRKIKIDFVLREFVMGCFFYNFTCNAKLIYIVLSLFVCNQNSRMCNCPDANNHKYIV